MNRKFVFALGLLLAVSLVLSGCAKMSTSESSEVMAGYAPQEPAYDYEVFTKEEMVESPRGFDAGVEDSSSASERMVIYNADMSIAVENPETTLEDVIRMAESAGGFVVSSSLSRSQTSAGTLPRAYLTVRVPAGQLDSIMDAIKDLTPDRTEDVIYENVSGQDVTAEFTDLEARLRNLEAAEAALVELMEEAQDPEDVLNIFDELTYYRGEIEVVKGRMKYLSESVALSSITVEIVAKESIQPITIVGWEPKGTVKRAVEALVSAGQWLADAAIWFGIFCLPFLIPLGVGVYFLVRLIKKRRDAKKAKTLDTLEQ